MLGGDRALDLLNTAHWRDGRYVDFVPDYVALARWSEPADLLAEREVTLLIDLAAKCPNEANAVHAAWIELRESFRRFLERRLNQREVEPNISNQKFLDLLENTLSPLRLRIADGEVEALPRENTLAMPLLRSALAITSFITLPPKGVVRICEADKCGGFFLDLSRSKPRRWCSMDTCGNRAKVKRFRVKLPTKSGRQ